MLETIIPFDVEPLPYVAVGAAVALIAAARLHASPRWWCPDLAWFWWPLRRYALPPLDKLLESTPVIYAKTRVRANEIVAEGLDVTHDEYLEMVGVTDYEAQPLASIARLTDDVDASGAGELERSSVARYAGPKPFGIEGLPDWLRRYQIHRRAFGPDGDLTETAHWELNPWRPDLALPHLLAIGFDAERGVKAAETDLEIELESLEEDDDAP